MSNALKYTQTGRVLVGCRRRADSIRIDVYDTGIGIPKSKQRVIFTEFHRLEQGAKVARGLGLGLSIVERIARMLGHKVEIESVAGRGSHFSVQVPRALTVPKEARRSEPRRVERRQLTGLIVLCIDNEPKILDGMEALLGGWGCEVLTATDLATALVRLGDAKAPPTGLLVDYHLDRGNGIDAIAQLRRRFGTDIPSILITADRSAAVLDAARAQEIQVLHKPVKPAALRALLAQWRVQRVAAAE